MDLYPTSLRRALTLPFVVLYGLGVTVGAGIYVLIGEVAQRAGMQSPVAFAIAAAVMLFPAATYAEFTGRMPLAGAESNFVRAGFRSSALAVVVGLAVAAVGVVSAAAIAWGSVGYIRVFVPVPPYVLLVGVILLMGGVAAWGIKESVAVAGIFTIIEVGGLLVIIAAGLWSEPGMVGRVDELAPIGLTSAQWMGIAGASLLAFFAFAGFEDMDSIAEEVVAPQRTIARAIFLTLFITTLLYMAVAAVALFTVPTSELAASEAPLALVFTRTTGLSPLFMSAVAIIATINGVVVQFIMASRMLFGLARHGSLPAPLAMVNATTQTPIVATIVVTVLVLLLGLAFDIAQLAEMTAYITLGVFTFVCLSLVLIKLRKTPAPEGTFVVPMWVPAVGVLVCLALLLSGIVS